MKRLNKSKIFTAGLSATVVSTTVVGVVAQECTPTGLTPENDQTATTNNFNLLIQNYNTSEGNAPTNPSIQNLRTLLFNNLNVTLQTQGIEAATDGFITTIATSNLNVTDLMGSVSMSLTGRYTNTQKENPQQL